jgi:hypothetical protein
LQRDRKPDTGVNVSWKELRRLIPEPYISLMHPERHVTMVNASSTAAYRGIRLQGIDVSDRSQPEHGPIRRMDVSGEEDARCDVIVVLRLNQIQSLII